MTSFAIQYFASVQNRELDQDDSKSVNDDIYGLSNFDGLTVNGEV